MSALDSNYEVFPVDLNTTHVESCCLHQTCVVALMHALKYVTQTTVVKYVLDFAMP